MHRNLKRSLIGAGIFILVVLAGYYILLIRTKSFSPEETVSFTHEGLELEIFYNRPYKKNRFVFGELVPFGEVWRTGANEATTFKTNKDILVDGSLLPAGKYTLWTIPMEDSWKVIFNSKMYDWGVTMDGLASREPQFDVLTLEVPVDHIENPVEQFTILFEEAKDFVIMTMAWDQTAVKLPIKIGSGPLS